MKRKFYLYLVGLALFFFYLSSKAESLAPVNNQFFLKNNAIDLKLNGNDYSLIDTAISNNLSIEESGPSASMSGISTPYHDKPSIINSGMGTMESFFNVKQYEAAPMPSTLAFMEQKIIPVPELMVSLDNIFFLNRALHGVYKNLRLNEFVAPRS